MSFDADYEYGQTGHYSHVLSPLVANSSLIFGQQLNGF